MEQHVSSIRAEVLRQLIGVSGGWFVRIVLVSLMFWLALYVYESLVDGTLSGRLSLMKQALFKGTKEFKVKTISTAPFLYFLGGLIPITGPRKSPVLLFFVTTSPGREWVICAPAAFLGCGSRFSGSLSGIEP